MQPSILAFPYIWSRAPLQFSLSMHPLNADSPIVHSALLGRHLCIFFLNATVINKDFYMKEISLVEVPL